MLTVLRAATLQDAPDVVRVLRGSRLRFMSYAPPMHSEAEDLHWARHTLIPTGGVTVACVDGNVVGVLAIRHADDAGWINQLYVEPEYRGRGVGTQLLAFALSSLRRPVRLYTFQQSERARAFYEGHGFRPVEFGDGSQNEEHRPDVLYELSERSDAA